MVPSVSVTSYITDGVVATTSILNSLLIRSIVTSICKSPKNPVLNPKPSATDVSGSYIKAASFNFSFASDSLNSSNLFVSRGYIPQKTTLFKAL